MWPLWDKWQWRVTLVDSTTLFSLTGSSWPDLLWCAVLSRSVMSGLCNCMDCSLPGSSVHGILQARILALVPCTHCSDASRRGAVCILLPPTAGTVLEGLNHQFHSRAVFRKRIPWCWLMRSKEVLPNFLLNQTDSKGKGSWHLSRELHELGA